MTAILNLIDNIVSLYIWILFFAVIASWLINFNVINTSNRAVYMIVDVLYKLTEPALRPIRRLLPNLGGLNFVVEHALEGGVNASPGLDRHGKSLSYALLGLRLPPPD